jgi:hypothetical protein
MVAVLVLVEVFDGDGQYNWTATDVLSVPVVHVTLE